MLISWSEQFVSSGLASMMNSIYPLFTVVLALFFLPDEQINWLRAIGLLIGFCGVVVLASTGFAGSHASGTLPGIIALLLAALSYAISMVFARRKTRGMQPIEQTAGQISLSLIMVIVATLILEPHLRLPTVPQSWIGLIWLGVLCSAVATLLWFSLLNEVGSTLTSLVSYVYPVIAVILGIVILGENFSWRLVIGGVLVILGVIWVNFFRHLPQIENHDQPASLALINLMLE